MLSSTVFLAMLLSLGAAVENTDPIFLYMQELQGEMNTGRRLQPSGRPYGQQQDAALALGLSPSGTVTYNQAAPEGALKDEIWLDSDTTTEMNFTIPQHKEAGLIYRADLWLFPHRFVPQEGNEVWRLYLKVSSLLEYQTNPRFVFPTVVWHSDEPALPLDVTAMARKQARNMQKVNAETADMTVLVEVIEAVRLNRTSSNEKSGCQEQPRFCQAFSDRQSGTPFLVIKYFEESAASSESGEDELADDHEHADVSSCRLYPLQVSLYDIFSGASATASLMAISPMTVDIGYCAGKCDLSSSTYHAILKSQQLIYLEGREKSACCVPVRYKPLQVLFHHELYMVVVEFTSMAASSCSCR